MGGDGGMREKVMVRGSHPFTFTEFLDHTATIRARNMKIQGNGKWALSPSTKGTFECQFGPIASGDSEWGGARALEITHYALTDTSPSIANGDIVRIGSVDYEFIGIDIVSSFIGGYTCVYLKEIKDV